MNTAPLISLRLLAPLSVMALIWILSSGPNPVAVPAGGDKLEHLAAFGILAGLWVFALHGRLTRRMVLVVAAAITIGWGAVDELHQHYVPSRQADMLDFAADAAGALLGVAIAARLFPRALASA